VVDHRIELELESSSPFLRNREFLRSGVNLPAMSILHLAVLAQISIEDLPPEVVDKLPTEVVDQIKKGLLDKLPNDVVSQLPASIQDKIPSGLLEAATSNPTFQKVLLAIGVLALIGFVVGLLRSALKWMIISAILAVGAWYLFFKQG
jgi:hypothetical protein